LLIGKGETKKLVAFERNLEPVNERGLGKTEGWGRRRNCQKRQIVTGVFNQRNHQKGGKKGNSVVRKKLRGGGANVKTTTNKKGKEIQKINDGARGGRQWEG